jgi:hypothetical protein
MFRLWKLKGTSLPFLPGEITGLSDYYCFFSVTGNLEPKDDSKKELPIE